MRSLCEPGEFERLGPAQRKSVWSRMTKEERAKECQRASDMALSRWYGKYSALTSGQPFSTANISGSRLIQMPRYETDQSEVVEEVTHAKVS